MVQHRRYFNFFSPKLFHWKTGSLRAEGDQRGGDGNLFGVFTWRILWLFLGQKVFKNLKDSLLWMFFINLVLEKSFRKNFKNFGITIFVRKSCWRIKRTFLGISNKIRKLTWYQYFCKLWWVKPLLLVVAQRTDQLLTSPEVLCYELVFLRAFIDCRKDEWEANGNGQ